MSAKFEKALEHVLRFEGGFVDHPADPGGRTNMGISQKTFDAWRDSLEEERADVATLTADEVKDIYKDRYWDTIRGDELPTSIAILVMDAAVNSGPQRAIKTLQKAANGANGNKALKIDGKIGPATIAASNAAAEDRLLDEFIVRRGVFYGGLKTFQTFGLGWARRLVAGSRLAYGVHDQTRQREADEDARTAPTGHTSPVRLKRFFFNDQTTQVYGSFFQHWGGWITAGHTIRAMKNRAPVFATGHMIASPNGLDAGLMGCTLPGAPPAEPNAGQRVIAMGFPAGAPGPAARVVRSYFPAQRCAAMDGAHPAARRAGCRRHVWRYRL